MALGVEKTAAEQAARDTAVDAAAQTWDNRPKDPEDNADSALWEALWEAFDFSWDGLADAGWDRGDDANEAQELNVDRHVGRMKTGSPTQWVDSQPRPTLQFGSADVLPLV